MSKGGSFEREMAKELSLWWTDGKREDVFYRSHSSGARFTQRKKAGKDTALQSGDLTCSDPCGEPLIKEWNLECKTGYGSKRTIKDGNKKVVKKIIDKWDVLDVIDSQQTVPVLMNMWQQSERDAELSNRQPVLIFRRNSRRACIVFERNYFLKLGQWLGRFDGSFCNISNKLMVLSLKDFLEWAINLPDILQNQDIIKI